MAIQMNMPAKQLATFLATLGRVVRQRLQGGDLVGIPGVGVFQLKHLYGKTLRGTLHPHIARPRFKFAANIKAQTRASPNKGTPHEYFKLRRRVLQAPTAAARRRQEFPGGFYVTGSGDLAGVGQTGSGPVPSRGRKGGAPAGFAARLRDVQVKRRFADIKTSATATGTR